MLKPKRLAAGRPASLGTVTDEEMQNTELGEHAHLILQALCRGAVRKSDGDKCHPAHAYVIASTRSGIPDALPKIFPDCRVERWSPMPRKLQGDAEPVFDYIQKWASKSKPDDTLPSGSFNAT